MPQKTLLIIIALTFSALLTHRIWRSAQLDQPEHNAMPAAYAGTEIEYQQLYMTPGGAYTRDDIESNGNTTPMQKYPAFKARHDITPRPGDHLCPVTRTKADPRCAWTIGGREYQFCCPPCIDEFVRLAKQKPNRINPPEHYIHVPIQARPPR